VRTRAGRTLLTVVGFYGVTIVVFGLSQTMWLSLLTVAIAVSWSRLFPALAHVDRLDGLQPAETAVS
jgi:hypothetical protein